MALQTFGHIKERWHFEGVFSLPWSVPLFWNVPCMCLCDTIYPSALITVCNCIFICFILLLSVPDIAWAFSCVCFQLTFLLQLLMQQPAVCRCGPQTSFLRCTIYLLLSLPPLSGMISETSWPVPKIKIMREWTTRKAACEPWATGCPKQRAQGTFYMASQEAPNRIELSDTPFLPSVSLSLTHLLLLILGFYSKKKKSINPCLSPACGVIQTKTLPVLPTQL